MNSIDYFNAGSVENYNDNIHSDNRLNIEKDFILICYLMPISTNNYFFATNSRKPQNIIMDALFLHPFEPYIQTNKHKALSFL